MEKIDMHIFTTLSHPTENAATPKEAVKIALKRGMNGLGMADHDYLGAAKQARDYAPKDFILLDGVEIRALEGHVVAFGIDQWDREYVPLEEALDYIEDNDGLALLPHPNIDVMQVSIKEPHIHDFRNKFQGMYLLSTRHLLFYHRMKEVYNKYEFTPLGCSYAHHPFEIGTIYTEFDDVSNEDDVISALRKNRVAGPRVLKTPSGLFNIARSNASIIRKFAAYKFGLELKERIPLYSENIWNKIFELKEFTQGSLLQELFNSGKLPGDVQRDPILTMILDDILENGQKNGILEKKGERYILTREHLGKASRRLYIKAYTRYFYELIKNIVSRK